MDLYFVDYNDFCVNFSLLHTFIIKSFKPIRQPEIADIITDYFSFITATTLSSHLTRELDQLGSGN